MIFTRLYDEGLAQASYLLGCTATGEAIVVDPNRDLDQYLAAAAARKLRITTVTETHIHADFVSGARELAQRTGASLSLSAMGGTEWQYAYAGSDGARLLHDGDTIQVGQIALTVRHTPGHTPEHLAFLVTDRASATEPMGALTGDFLFVGDVGRPDLLEKAVRVAGSAESAARQLFRSLRAFAELPDYLQVWPGHGAGSACGKGLSPVPQSTLGYEKRFNWALSVNDEDQFVRMVLAGQPEPPRYFARMKVINRSGPAALGGFRRPPALDPATLADTIQRGAIVVDTRPAAEFAGGHVPGTIGVPYNRSFLTYAGSVLPDDRDLALLVDSLENGVAERAARDLALIGLERVVGAFDRDAIEAWVAGGGTLTRVGRVNVKDLHGRTPAPVVLDVRGASEWEAGHIAGALHIPLGELPDQLDRVPRNQPVVVHCQGGGRAMIAAGLLQAQGFDQVQNLDGGLAAWQRAGLPVQTGNGDSPGD